MATDSKAHNLIAIRWQDRSRSREEAKVVIKRVSLLCPILEEETVAQSVIANGVFYLEKGIEAIDRNTNSSRNYN